MIQRFWNDQRGEGVGIILLYIAILGVAWFAVNFVYDWITSTRDKRMDSGKKGEQVTTTTIPREIGGYQVTF